MYFTEEEINGMELDANNPDWNVNDNGTLTVAIIGVTDIGQRIFGVQFWDENGNDDEEYGDSWIDAYATITRLRKGMYYVSKIEFDLWVNNLENEQRYACFNGIEYEEGNKIFNKLNYGSKLDKDDEGQLLKWVRKEYEHE